MKKEQRKKNIEKAVELFRDFITYQIFQEDLADTLDEIMMEYASYQLNEDTEGYPGRSDNMYTLYQIKRILRLKDDNGMFSEINQAVLMGKGVRN